MSVEQCRCVYPDKCFCPPEAKLEAENERLRPALDDAVGEIKMLRAEVERLREAQLTPEEAEALRVLIVQRTDESRDPPLNSAYTKLRARVDDNSAR